MTLASLLTQDITIVRQSDGAVDDYGNPTDTWTPDGSAVRGRLEQRSAQEVTLDTQRVLSDWLLFLHPTVVVTPRDRVTDEFGRTFEILSADLKRTPTRDSHLEVALRHVDSA